jgi:hypothetical protein
MSSNRELFRIALLDDYQNVALSIADWSALDAQATVTVFKAATPGRVYKKRVRACVRAREIWFRFRFRIVDGSSRSEPMTRSAASARLATCRHSLAHFRDTTQPLLAAGRGLFRRQAKKGGELARARENLCVTYSHPAGRRLKL